MGLCQSCMKSEDDKISNQPLLWTNDSENIANNNIKNQYFLNSNSYQHLNLRKKSNTSPVNPIDFILKAKLEDQANEKLKTEINELPISSDLPRMIGRISVYNINGHELFSSASLKNSLLVQDKIKDFILLLSDQLNIEKVKNNIYLRFHEFIPNSFEGDINASLKEVLRVLVGDKNPISNILKCINQAIIAPAVMKMKIELLNCIDYKDGKSKWDIDIHLNEKVKIVHKKSEISIPDEFEFEWNLTILFDYYCSTIEKVDFEVVNIIFNEHTTEERKSFIEKKLKMLK